jgi:tetratricopeptide (TPR) repeat protein
MDDAVAHAERLGLANLAKFSRNVRVWLQFRTGRWDEAVPPSDAFIAACEAGDTHYHEGGMRLRRASVRLARDDVDGALEDVRKSLPLAERAKDPQARAPWLALATRLLVDAGRLEDARPLVEATLQAEPVGWGLVDLAFVAEELGCAAELETRLELSPTTRWVSAARAALQHDFVAAANLLHEIGDAELEALGRLRAAEQLVAEGRRPEADEQLQLALAFWREVRATRYIRHAEALLAAAS